MYAVSSHPLPQCCSVAVHQSAIGNCSCKINQNIHSQYCITHEDLVLVAFMATRVSEGHPVRVNTVGKVATHPAVVGREWRVVKSPVLKIIVGGVSVP